MPHTDNQRLEDLAINAIRMLSADAVQNANSGHPGMPMGAAAMTYALWKRHLKYNPQNPSWFDRDRFVLSAGHGSMLVYSMLYLTGYDLPLDELKRFRQWESMTPGHPERGYTPGIEVATGPLGQGFGNAVGMAMAEAWLAATYNKPGHDIVNHYTYAISGDGCLMEGVTQEAASLAGHLKLGKLIVLYDENRITLAGGTDLTFTENVRARFDAYGWQTIQVENGNSVEEVSEAIAAAKADTGRPTLILVKTHIGFGSPKKQDNFSSHGSPLGEEELAATKKNLGWGSTEKFWIPDEALAHFREAIPAGAAAQSEWTTRFEAYRAAFPQEAKQFEMVTTGGVPEGWDSELPKWTPADKAIATRVAGGEVLNALAKKITNIVGGSADLNPSTNTALKGAGDFQSPDTPAGAMGAVGGVWGFAGRNMAFGVREHAMGSAVNGMAAHGGVLPFSATFFVFSDYMKPAVRLGAMMGIHAFYVFTHDSVGVGEDGPTHEPVEHLAALRTIPGLTVLRPADPNETTDAWAFAIRNNTGPTAFVLSRQNVPHLDRSKSVGDLTKGAYILADAEGGSPDVILIGTGSEVGLCVKAQEKLAGYGVKTRVVSMPGMSLFEKQDDAYRESVLPRSVKKRVTVEAAAGFGWDRYAGDEGAKIGIDRFGASAPGDIVMANLGFTVGNVTATALRLLGRNDEAALEAGSNETAFAGPTLHHA
ncbi:MAG: transketolase [Bryobacterales bacterium]|nr:transketolase [Bryobacterales bacterium]